MASKKILINHYDVLSAFRDDYYKDLIMLSNLGDEAVIKVNGEQKFVYPVKYKGKVFAIPSEIVDKGKFPIKIKNTTKIAYRSNVYHLVTKYSSVKIRAEKILNFRQLCDSIADFEHTEKDKDFLIYKIANITLYLKKGFMRAVSEASFGKNSVMNILKILMGDLAIINPRSTPAFEHKLINDFIVLDELTNLPPTQVDLMQEALLRVCDWGPSYEKGTRGSAKIGTKDEYDISKLSILIIYNILDYYLDCNQGDKYFDNVFQFAVKDRLFPIYCKGILDARQFAQIEDPKKYAEMYKYDIRNIIRSLKYYQQNFYNDLKDYRLERYNLSKSGRMEKTFNMICKGINLYAENEEEYKMLVEHLYNMHLNYNDMMRKQAIEEVDIDEKTDKPKLEKKEKQKTL